MKTILVTAASLLIAATSPAWAGSGVGDPATEAKPANTQVTVTADGDKEADMNKIVCERVKTTGSRLGSERICMSKREWENQKAEVRRSIDRVQASRVKND